MNTSFSTSNLSSKYVLSTSKGRRTIPTILRIPRSYVIMLRDFDLPVIVEHVENNSPSLRVYLQKVGFKKKVEQVKE
jgi:hypothetical protein